MNIVEIRSELRKKYKIALQVRDFGVDENYKNAEKLKKQSEYNYEWLLQEIHQNKDFAEKLENKNFKNIDKLLNFVFENGEQK